MAANTFSLKLQDFSSAIVVHRFKAKEGLSKLFKFDVDGEMPDEPMFEARPGVVGCPAIFTYADTSSDARQVHGIIARVTRLDRVGKDGASIYRFRLVPHLWARRHNVTSRVFQDRTVPEIVSDVLRSMDTDLDVLRPTSGDWSGSRRLTFFQELKIQIVGTYPKRPYAVQYRESDFAFIQRILAEEGIYWYFERTADDAFPSYTSGAEGQLRDQSNHDPLDVLVLADSAAYPAVFDPPPTLARPATGLSTGSHDVLTSFTPGERMKPDTTLLRDYDFERPRQNPMAFSTTGELSGNERAETEIQRGRFLRVYEHRGEYLDLDVTEARTDRQLEQQRRHVRLCKGASRARHLTPGYRFNVAWPAEIAAVAGAVSEDYVITRIEHHGAIAEHGAADDTYTNRFECVPSSVVYRPKRPEPKPIQVLESAVVTGKADGSVYTDQYGRIRVQFHWDMTGSSNETSTAWLRVLQGWAGASFGVQFIPRVGMEVMVSFLGGDPDSPVVLGAIYNRTHPHPFHLPSLEDALASKNQALRSGIRTQSYPGGAGFNEISFEDQSGAEQVYVHAQRDMDVDVEHHHSLVVKRNHVTEVGESQTNRVKEQQVELVGGAASRRVDADETVEVRGNRATTVGGTDSASFEKERRVRVGLNDRLEVEGNATTWVKDDLFVRADGSAVALVGSSKEPRGYAARIEGTADVSATDLVELVSAKGIRLRCGESVLEIMPDRIDLLSPNVSIRSPNAEIATKEDKIELWAKCDATFTAGQSVGLSCELGARVDLGANAAVKGAQIAMRSTDGGATAITSQEAPPTVIALTDEQGAPLAWRRFILVYPSGAERSFVLDKNGECEIRGLEESVSIRFPELVDVHA